MRLHVYHHPLITHKLTVPRIAERRRRRSASSWTNWSLCSPTRATREVAVTEPPSGPPSLYSRPEVSEPRPIVVPVLRAGLGMLGGMTRMLPGRGWLPGHASRRRHPGVRTYANRLPDDLSGRQCFVLDPMLATGHTMVAATNYLFSSAARRTPPAILAARKASSP